MAYERKNGDAVINKNKTRQSMNEPRSTIKVLIDGQYYTGGLWLHKNYQDDKRPQDRQPNPNDPDLLGHLDYNGKRCRIALWLKGQGPQENRRPNINGDIRFDGFSRPIALWERKNSNTGDIFWSGSMNMEDKYKKVFTPSNSPNQNQPQGNTNPSGQSGYRGNNQASSSQANNRFDLDLDLPF